MTTLLNRQVLLRSRPESIPQAEHFELVATHVPALQAGQILVHNIYLSVEPAMRYRGENLGKRLIRIAEL